MPYDMHVHSIASPDSQMEAGEAVFMAGKNGAGLAFTEHVDFVAAGKLGDAPYMIDEFVCDFDIYPREYEKYRGDNVLLGLEIGLCAAFDGQNRQTAVAYDYDLIIGSVHAVDGVDIYHSLNGLIPLELPGIARYLRYTAEMLEIADYIQVLGHIDYIARYGGLRTEYRYANFADEFDAVFKAAIARDIILEINTESLHSAKNWDTIMFDIYRRYAQLGGKYCTLGSDAHKPHEILRGFDVGRRLADEAGLTPVCFRERKLGIS